MATLKQTSARILVATLVGAVSFATYVHESNRRLLDRRHPIAEESVQAASGTEAVRRGKRLADLTGCTDCHGPDLRGRLFEDEGWLHGRYYASNLTLKAKAYSDGDLARIVRRGVRPDGRGVVAMPAMGYVRLTDSEMADILAFVRSLPAGGANQPDHYIGPLDQWELWTEGKMKPAVTYVAAERAKVLADAGPEHAASLHLAGIVCAECHGGDLKGNGWDSGAPNLGVVRSYGLPEFTRLLRTGVGADGKEHGLMSAVARTRFHLLTDQEIADLHAYLVARAKLPP
ncbi:MAG: c-type cytochrome [Casimicrobiaceae bacterium]